MSISYEWLIILTWNFGVTLPSSKLRCFSVKTRSKYEKPSKLTQKVSGEFIQMYVMHQQRIRTRLCSKTTFPIISSVDVFNDARVWQLSGCVTADYVCHLAETERWQLWTIQDSGEKTDGMEIAVFTETRGQLFSSQLIRRFCATGRYTMTSRWLGKSVFERIPFPPGVQ